MRSHDLASNYNCHDPRAEWYHTLKIKSYSNITMVTDRTAYRFVKMQLNLDKTYNETRATSKDQPAHPCNLVFADHMCLLQHSGYPKRDKKRCLALLGGCAGWSVLGIVGFACDSSNYLVYSRTSIGRTPMAHLPWLIWTCFRVPTKFIR